MTSKGIAKRDKKESLKRESASQSLIYNNSKQSKAKFVLSQAN
jgi:hypothetical protein